MLSKNLPRILTIVLALLLVGPVVAPPIAYGQVTTYTFIAMDGTWDDENDWNPAQVPQAGDRAVIPDDTICRVKTRDEDALEVVVEAGARLSIEEGYSLTLHGAVANDETALTVESGGVVDFIEDGSGNPGVVLFQAPAADARYDFLITGAGLISAAGESALVTAVSPATYHVRVIFDTDVTLDGTVGFEDLDVRNNGLFYVTGTDEMTFEGTTPPGAAIVSGAGTFEVDGAGAAMVMTDVLVGIDGRVYVTDGDLEFGYTAAPILPPTVGAPFVADLSLSPLLSVDGGTVSVYGNPPTFAANLRLHNVDATLANGGLVECDGDLTLVQRSTLTVTNGDVDLGGDLFIDKSSATVPTNGTVTAANLDQVDGALTVSGGSVTLSGALIGNLVADAENAVTVSGGTLTAGSVEAIDTIIEVSGGTLDVNGTFKSGLFSGSESSVTVNGGTLNLDGAYTGGGTTVMVVDGTLDINENLENWGEFWFTGGTITLALDKIAAFKPIGVDQGSTYYVATTGSDTGQGTIGDPWLTLQHAAGQVGPGDTVRVRGGTYATAGGANDRILVMDSTTGSAGLPITFRAYDEENEPVTLSATNGSHSDIIVEIEVPYVNFEGFILTGANKRALDVKQAGGGVHHVAVRRCTAYDNDYVSSFAGGTFQAYGTVRYVLFEECVSYGNHNGLQFRNSDPGSPAPQDPKTPPLADEIAYGADLPEDVWAAWTGWEDRGARYCIIRRCLAYDNVVSAANSDGYGSRYAMDCLFEDNIAWGNGEDGFDLLAEVRCIVRGNIAFRGSGTDGNGMKIGVRGSLATIIHHNICFENPSDGIDLPKEEWGRVYNNTCFDNTAEGDADSYGIHLNGGRAQVYGADIVNNLCIDNDRDLGANPGATVIQRADFNYMNDDNSHAHMIQQGSSSETEVFTTAYGFCTPATPPNPRRAT